MCRKCIFEERPHPVPLNTNTTVVGTIWVHLDAMFWCAVFETFLRHFVHMRSGPEKVCGPECRDVSLEPPPQAQT